MLPQPHIRNARRLSHAHGLASSAFARHYSRNHYCFLFLRVLRCFTSPRSLQNPMCSGTGNWLYNASWVSPFGHPRITARLPTPRGLSQAPTSFIGSWCQDIHRLPLVACHNNNKNITLQRDARVHYTVLKIRAGTPAPNRHLPVEACSQGKQHTHQTHPTNSLVRAGPSHPANHHWSARDPEETVPNPQNTNGPVS